MRETENNICGNHAIALMMHVIISLSKVYNLFIFKAFENSKSRHDIDTKFIRYS